MRDRGKQQLDQAFDQLEEDTPDRISRLLRWLRNPQARRVRMPLGVVLVVAGLFGFLPLIGFYFVPLGLLLLAQDLPFLREPVARATLWAEGKWHRFKAWRKQRRKA